MSNNFLLNNNEINSNIVKNILLMLQRRGMISDYEGILNSIGDLNGIGPEVVLKIFEDSRMLEFWPYLCWEKKS